MYKNGNLFLNRDKEDPFILSFTGYKEEGGGCLPPIVVFPSVSNKRYRLGCVADWLENDWVDRFDLCDREGYIRPNLKEKALRIEGVNFSNEDEINRAYNKRLMVEYVPTGYCEDHETIERVIQVCKDQGLDSGGAIMPAIIKIEEFDDGDQGIYVKFEAPPHNDIWSKSAFKLVAKLWDCFPDAHVLLNHNSYKIIIHTYYCDPP